MTSHDKQILRRMLAQDATLGGVFDAFASRVSDILRGYSYGDGGIWTNNQLIEVKVDMEVESLRKNLEAHIRNNQQWAWGVSNAKNDELVDSYIKGLALPSKEGLFARNMEAFEQFSKRKINGLTVSDRVWDISRQAKTQLEFYLESGIGNGRSAATLSRDIRQLLKKPDKLFRRVRDKNGNLVPSKPMKDYHPGQGVYRSSYMNAKRLAVSEINMSYRNADHERWGQLDFVTGIEVKLSSAHPRTDICDHMKGKYPKEFKFTGWHPFCLCFAVPVLMDKDRFMEYVDTANPDLLKGQEVNSIPQPAVSYLRRNQKTIDGWNSKPIWVKDNFNNAKLEGGLKFGKIAKKENVINYKGYEMTEKPWDVLELEKELGVEFKLYEKTGSIYGEFNGKKIRLSNHASKFAEKFDGLDLNYNEYSVADMYHKIMGVNPFDDIRKGEVIKHRILGEMKFISYENGVVTAEFKGEIKKYTEDIFTFNKVKKVNEELLAVQSRIQEIKNKYKRYVDEDEHFKLSAELKELESKLEMLKNVKNNNINISNLIYSKKEAIFDSSIKIKNPAATENSGNVKMNYTEKQIEKAKKAYNDFLKYRSVESFEPQYIGYAAAEQRAAYHNKIVKEILSGNKELEKEWKLFFLKQEAKADKKAVEIKSKLSANKAATQSVLDLVKSNGFKLADYYEFLKKNKKYAKEFYSKKFTAESAKEFMKL